MPSTIVPPVSVGGALAIRVSVTAAPETARALQIGGSSSSTTAESAPTSSLASVASPSVAVASLSDDSVSGVSDVCASRPPGDSPSETPESVTSSPARDAFDSELQASAPNQSVKRATSRRPRMRESLADGGAFARIRVGERAIRVSNMAESDCFVTNGRDRLLSIVDGDSAVGNAPDARVRIAMRACFDVGARATLASPCAPQS